MAEAAGAGSSQCTDVASLHLSVAEEGERWSVIKYGRVGNPSDKEGKQTRVYESNEESGFISLTILSMGHFFISQRHTLLEGFSLISAKSWLKIGKKLDWLLFGSKIKDEFRMFRVQFDGDSKSKAQENCDRCFERLHHFLCDQNESTKESSQNIPQQRITLTQVAQGMVVSKQVNTISPCPPLNEELSSFLKLCLLDQNFPGFVEAVEKELYKLIKN
ncbi:meiotic recombination protein REC114 [Anomaloglossus baeobatrachus]|uniref:meiotic recombination protein REC114 n=1 Tax=Anomaloglossus baeobatrachus TaxID=238106 RepID=UPI003F4FCA3A